MSESCRNVGMRRNRKSRFYSGRIRDCRNVGIFPTCCREKRNNNRRKHGIIPTFLQTLSAKGFEPRRNPYRVGIRFLRSRTWSSSVLTGPGRKTRPQGRLDFKQTGQLMSARLFEVQSPKKGPEPKQSWVRGFELQTGQLMRGRLFEVQSPKKGPEFKQSWVRGFELQTGQLMRGRLFEVQSPKKGPEFKQSWVRGFELQTGQLMRGRLFEVQSPKKGPELKQSWVRGFELQTGRSINH